MPNFFLGEGARRWKTQTGDTGLPEIAKEFSILPGPRGPEDLQVFVHYGTDRFLAQTVIPDPNTPLNNFIYFRRRIRDGGTTIFRHYVGKVIFHDPQAVVQTLVKGFTVDTDEEGKELTLSPPLGMLTGDDEWVATRPPMSGI